jgi:hypothetical protein
MAISNKPRGRFWSRLHFLLRFLGLTGLLAAGAGAVIAVLYAFVPAWNNDLSAEDNARTIWEAARGVAEPTIRGVIEWKSGDVFTRVVVGLVVIGGGLALLALLVELIGMVFVAFGRRGAFGGNALIQVALALALLVGINIYAHRDGNYRRFDLTRGHEFTLPDEVRQQLRELKGETTIVAYQRHKSVGFLSDKPDRYDSAADRKVVEKVKDLVEQFRAFGSHQRFKVKVLDSEQEDFDQELAALPEELRHAIDNAPENSIFFYADGKVQRLGFNDFYALDKTASKEAEGGKGNLVLRYQGVGPFANKVLNVEQKTPRVAIAVTHEALTSEGKLKEYTLAGVRKVLHDRGFEVRDLILRKARRGPGGPEAVVYTPDENRYEKIADTLTVFDAQLRFLDNELERWKKATAADLKKQGYTESDREEQVAGLTVIVEQGRKRREQLAADQKRLQVESLEEQRRLTDVKAKMDRSLADCDLLILPRMTLRDISDPRFNLPNDFHRLDDAQVASIKEFIKAGKPVLACLGPVNEPPDEPSPPSAGPDGMEALLEQLGFKLSKQTVLFDSGLATLAEYQAALQGKREPDWMSRGDDTDVPPLVLKRAGAKGTDNRLGRSLRLTADGLGLEQGLDLRIRHPRPLSFEAKDGKAPAHDAAFLLTDPLSWNEDKPFPTKDEMPTYKETKKRGPTAVGLATEVVVPSDWYAKGEAPAEPRKVRMVVIGDGGLFVGPSLSPAKEKLLLDTCNWALGRDDQLTQPGETWEYPRVHMPPREQALWTWGTVVGLPVLCVYFGLVVVMWRRLR